VPAKLAQRVVTMSRPMFFAGAGKARRRAGCVRQGRYPLDIAALISRLRHRLSRPTLSIGQNPTHHGYAGYSGVILPLRHAIVDYYLRRFNVQLDVKTECCRSLEARKASLIWHGPMWTPAMWCWYPIRVTRRTPAEHCWRVARLYAGFR